jgi:hypothetical protein
MHFDIAEVIRQKQQKQPREIRTENGKVVVISTSDGTLVVSPEVRRSLGAEEEIAPSKILLEDE